MYEAVILDISNETIYRKTGENPLDILKGVIEESSESYSDEFKLTFQEFNSGYRFAKTTDSEMKDTFSFKQAMDLMDAGTVSLLVIVGWDRLTAPIGFFRKL